MDDFRKEKNRIRIGFILICGLLTTASVLISSMPAWISSSPLMVFAGPPLLISNIAGLVLSLKQSDSTFARIAQQAILHFTYFFVLLSPICSALLKRIGVDNAPMRSTRARALIALTVHLLLYIALLLIVRSE